MTDEPVVRVEVKGRVGVLTLNRPDRRNALHADMYPAIKAALADWAGDPGVGAIVLTGAGSSFCAGGDVRDPRPCAADGRRPTHDERVAGLVRDGETAAVLHQHPKLTIAAVNGPAVGAGMSLALACDLRIASTSARLVTGWARLAFPGDFGGAWFLTRLVGPAKALELLASNGSVSAEEAHGLGLVNRVVDDVEFPDAWADWAAEFAAGPIEAIVAMKRNVADAQRLGLRDSMAREADRMVRSAGTLDHKEAVKAWLERRPPRFG